MPIKKKGLKELGPKYFQTPKPFWKFALTNLIGGFFKGIGQIIGVAFIVGVLVWILSYLPIADEVREFFSNIQRVNTFQ